MKTVVHLTAVSSVAAGVVPFDMHRFLLSAGYNSYIVTPLMGNSADRVVSLHHSSLFRSWHVFVTRLMRRIRGGEKHRFSRDRDYYFNQYSEVEYYKANRIAKVLPPEVDVIIIHFYDTFLNSTVIAELSRITRAKILWLMMDMAPLTGGCHYAWNCDGYTRQCGCCPALYSKNLYDLSRKQFQKKMHNLRTTQIELVAGSEWQYRQAQESAIFKGKNMHKILAAVDPEMYRPGNNVSIRERMGVPSNSKVLLFGAAYLDEKRKGYDHFVQVLSQCASNLNEPEKDLLFAIILGSGDSSPFQATGIKYIHCGFTPANELPDLYRAADLYICCSTQDSGPTMINQSIMSGTPVLAYEMGVALDLVIDGETGFRVPLGNIDMMAKRLLEFLSLDAEILDRISKNCRAIGLEKCEPSSQMKAIANIIN